MIVTWPVWESNVCSATSTVQVYPVLLTSLVSMIDAVILVRWKFGSRFEGLRKIPADMSPLTSLLPSDTVLWPLFGSPGEIWWLQYSPTKLVPICWSQFTALNKSLSAIEGLIDLFQAQLFTETSEYSCLWDGAPSSRQIPSISVLKGCAVRTQHDVWLQSDRKAEELRTSKKCSDEVFFEL